MDLTKEELAKVEPTKGEITKEKPTAGESKLNHKDATINQYLEETEKRAAKHPPLAKNIK